MPQQNANAGFRHELTDAEWETVARVFVDHCFKNLLPLVRLWIGRENSGDAEDVLMKVVEEAFNGLVDGLPKYYAKPQRGETRAQMLESLHAMCRGNEPQPVPEWLTNRVSFVARRRATVLFRGAMKRSKSGAIALDDMLAEPIDEHATPDEGAARREELEWQEGHLANAMAQFPADTQKLVTAWFRQPSREAEQAFLGQLPDRDKDRLDRARLRLKEELQKLGSLESHLRTAPTPAIKPPLDDNVHFTITSPNVLLVGNASVVDVWVHLISQQGNVLRLVAKVRDARPRIAGSKGPVPLARGTHLAIQLSVPGCEVRPVEDTVFWSGEIANATFAVTVPKGTRPGTLASEAIVRVHGLSIARIAFVLTAGTRHGTPGVVNARVKRHGRAFASYASKDRDAVLGRIQGMQQETRDLDVFVDVARLKSGQRWPDKLRQEILSRDVLYLFWSKAASESAWVEREWRIAYTERGVTFIDPVPLEPPDVVRPPKELAELHFNDWVLAFMRGQSATSAKKR